MPNYESDIRAGHYVDGRFRYPLTQPAQARAKAMFMASEYGRSVYVYTRAAAGSPAVINQELSSREKQYGSG